MSSYANHIKYYVVCRFFLSFIPNIQHHSSINRCGKVHKIETIFLVFFGKITFTGAYNSGWFTSEQSQIAHDTMREVMNAERSE